MTVKRSSGNVFKDLGFEKEEAANLNIRAELMMEIIRLIDKRNLTQAQAAKLFGVTQPRVSNLLNGKIDLFTIDALVNILGKLERTVDIKIRKRVSSVKQKVA